MGHEDGTSGIDSGRTAVRPEPGPAGLALGDPQDALQTALAALELGDWRALVQAAGSRLRAIAGEGHMVRWASAIELVALAMQAQAEGHVRDAWDRLGEAAALLPRQLIRRDPSSQVVLAVLRPAPPDDASPDEQVVVRLARLLWREQYELAELRHRFAPGKVKARDELIEGCIQYLIWVTFDPTTWYRRTGQGGDDRTVVEPSRSVLCAFASEIRWFADPHCHDRIQVSQRTWQGVRGYRGLAAAAFDRLADRAAAPWCGVHGTEGLVVKLGRVRAWEYARQRKQDLASLQFPLLAESYRGAMMP